MWAGAPEVVFLNPRRLFLFFRDNINIGIGGFVAPRGVAFALSPGTGGADLAARSWTRFCRRRSLRARVSGFPNPGGTGAGLW